MQDARGGPGPARRRTGFLHLLAGSWRPAVAGALAAGVAIAAAELVAGTVAGAPSLVTSMGSLVISLQPPGAKDVMVSLFGTNDKLALNVAVVVVALVLAGAAGILAARRRWLGTAAFVAFGVLAAAAALRDPLASPSLAVVNAVIAVAAGLIALFSLLPLAGAPAGTGDVTEIDWRSAEWTRRRFLIASAGTLAA